jgi:predicted nucleic acid-binding protein
MLCCHKGKIGMGIIRAHYLDSSAAVSLLVNEDRSRVLRDYLKQHTFFLMTSFCVAETLGVLKRKYLNKCITQNEYLIACESLTGQVKDEQIIVRDINIGDRDIFSEVRELAKKYAFDIVDAFEIVTIKKGVANEWNIAGECFLITGDKGLANAARQENLRVWDYVHEPPP